MQTTFNAMHVAPLMLLGGIILATGCKNNETQFTPTEFIPEAPSYADAEMWYIQPADSDMGADVFYIPSTWEFDWFTTDSIVSHYADPVNTPTHRSDVEREMTKSAGYMAAYARYYSPHYRHISLDSWATLNEDTIARRFHDVAFVDVCAAFSYYLQHYNEGRPFILAGFSQGALSVVELMKTLPADVRQRLIAAYVLGYKVMPADVAAYPEVFIGAQGADDTGVTICYNSVSDAKYAKSIVSTPNAFTINPVSWSTDTVPAILQDTISVQINPDSNVLVLHGFDGSYLPNILNVLNTGDYHGVEPWLYSECLRQNMRTRIEAYTLKQGEE